MSEISALGYLGLSVSNLAEWTRFAETFLGLDVRNEGDGALLRLDDYDWRIALEPGGSDDLAYLGWEVPDAAALSRVAERLKAAGVAVEKADGAERGVLGLIRFADPLGNKNEIFFGPTMRTERPFYPRRPLNGFVTGDQGLGHVILNAQHPDQLLPFYIDVLGFRITDVIAFEPVPGFNVEITFLRCNSRHHSLAIGHIPMPKRMQHMMLQFASIDDVGRLYYQAQDEGRPITLTLGRHSNDKMLSFYMRTPSGFDIEIGWGAIDVDEDSWHVQLHRHQSAWGHHPGPGLKLP